jgi:dihydrofolate reductase
MNQVMTFSPRISAIAAIGVHNLALGKNNDIMWHIPTDQRYFRDTTFGHVVIMGRKTYEQIDKKPLKGRTNIVVTTKTDLHTPDFIFVHRVEEALKKAREIEKEEIFIVGGGEIYTLFLPYTNKLYLTLIEGDFADADAFFPDYSHIFTKEISRKTAHENGYTFHFVELEK